MTKTAYFIGGGPLDQAKFAVGERPPLVHCAIEQLPFVMMSVHTPPQEPLMVRTLRYTYRLTRVNAYLTEEPLLVYVYAGSNYE